MYEVFATVHTKSPTESSDNTISLILFVLLCYGIIFLAEALREASDFQIKEIPFMKQKQVNIHDLIMNVCAELERIGYQKYYVWGHLYVAMTTIEKYHTMNNQLYYNSKLTAEIVADMHKRFQNGEISGCRRSVFVKAAKYLDEYFANKRITFGRDTYVPKPVLCNDFQDVLCAFMKSRDFYSTTERGFEWAIRKYLLFLQDRGYSNIADISISDVKDFITGIGKAYSVATLRDIQCYVRQFHEFLHNQNFCALDCTGILSVRISKHHKEKDYITDKELSDTLAQIDTSTSLGKRNMAIILLAVSTGLRAKDISYLKLSDIDWENGEIHIIQSKTGGEVFLPLTVDAGKAIQDYILNARPQTNHSEIFISAVTPFRPIAAVSIRTMFAKYLNKAGITRVPFDGKTFHGLRRRMGHNLLCSGHSIHTIAQILGHKAVDSTHSYLSLDCDNLKMCSLDFSNIPVGGDSNV